MSGCFVILFDLCAYFGVHKAWLLSGKGYR